MIRGKFIGERTHVFADDRRRAAAARLPGDLLRRRKRLKADRVQLPVALLGDDQDIHSFRFVADRSLTNPKRALSF